MQLHIQKDPDEVNSALATWIIAHIKNVLRTQNRFTWALSGGNSPKRLYQLMAQPVNAEKILWEKLHIFFGDERCVPFNDSRNNGKMAYEALLKHVSIPEEQIHYMRTDIAPEESVLSYEKHLHSYFNHAQNSFDLVLLGLGVDGHTLSLFPGSPILKEDKGWVQSIYYKEEDMSRITLTPNLINRASAIVFLVTGKDKAAIVNQLLDETTNSKSYPASVIHPQSGELHWFLDENAASQL